MWGGAARPGAEPQRVPGLVPARGRRGRSNGPLFPTGTQRAPVRPDRGQQPGLGGLWRYEGGATGAGVPCGAGLGWGTEAAEPVTTVRTWDPTDCGCPLLGATLSLARTPPSPKKMPSWGAQGMRGLSWVLQPGCPRSGCAATVLASSLPPLASSLPPAALLMGEAKSCPPPPPQFGWCLVAMGNPWVSPGDGLSPSPSPGKQLLWQCVCVPPGSSGVGWGGGDLSGGDTL